MILIIIKFIPNENEIDFFFGEVMFFFSTYILNIFVYDNNK